MKRCSWVDLSKPLYVAYHDHEWGEPVYDDQVFFEFLVLESAQAGLNWYTILKRRDNYRNAFSDFDPKEIAQYGEKELNALIINDAIIRNKMKIEAAINNAKCFLFVQKEFGSFSHYIWQFANHTPVILPKDTATPSQSQLSDTITKDMKKRGFTFIGSTIIYSLLQACGIVNDHESGCFKCPHAS